MRKHRWRELGNRIYRSGYIEHVSVPIWVWLLDKWLARHPHWNWWGHMWGKLLPEWGDPFCAAYCFVWSKFYYRQERTEHSIDVGFDKLSDQYKSWYDGENDADEAAK